MAHLEHSWYDACSAKLDRLEEGIERGDSLDVVLAAWSDLCAAAVAAVDIAGEAGDVVALAAQPRSRRDDL